MSNSSTSIASNNEMSSAGGHESSTNGLHKFSLDLLIQYIENTLSAITNQGLDSKKMHSGTELKDLVQPLASDFSKLLQGISDGAKLFSDQSNFLKCRVSSEAHSLAVNVLKGLGNSHWVAVGLLAIANVLERFDGISTNDRECVDLLKDMLKLVKYLKLMRDLKVVFHKEVLDDMREAVQLVLSGAILCRSFIKSNKLSKFLLTKKIRDELVYLRGKVNSTKADLQGHVQLLIVKTLNFITGRHDENNYLEMTEQHHAMDTECELEQSCEAEIDRSEAANVSSEVQDICNEKDRYKKVEMTLRSFFQLGKFLRKIFPSRLGRQPKLAHYVELRMMLKKIQPSQIDFNRSELTKATKGFSQKIGEGGSGSVYRGTLSDGRAVAVKTWNNKYYQYDEIGLMNELRILTKLQHRNIMQLVGYCSEEDLMLVYDFMPRDLGRIICGEDEIIIDWPTRRRIIMDIIRGLSYLHEGPDGCIVHRDIKPSNILLDENLNAKISDFVISRILEADNFKHVSEISKHGGNAQYTNKEISVDGADVLDKTHLTTNILGTAGYIDPEYFQTYRLTPMSDIYGFGVLLLNVVSGKRAIFHTEDEMCHLARQARRLHKEDRLVELIDPRLMNRDGLVYWSSILRMIKIALYCIVLDSHMRPSASQLLKMLSSDNEMPILPLHLSSAGYGYNFSQEENWVPSPPMTSIVAADHSSQENIPTHSPPVKSLVVEGHSSAENIPIDSPPLKSVALNANSSLQKIRESDTKWSVFRKQAQCRVILSLLPLALILSKYYLCSLLFWLPGQAGEALPISQSSDSILSRFTTTSSSSRSTI